MRFLTQFLSFGLLLHFCYSFVRHWSLILTWTLDNKHMATTKYVKFYWKPVHDQQIESFLQKSPISTRTPKMPKSLNPQIYSTGRQSVGTHGAKSEAVCWADLLRVKKVFKYICFHASCVCVCVCVCVVTVVGDTDSWVDSPGCVFAPVSIPARDVGRKPEKGMCPLSLWRARLL